VTLSAGVRLGPYEVDALLGAGGMGEVYRAHDTRLGRTVAVKVLAASFAADPERRTRFEREARAIASLNHPHICTLHDVGQQDGLDFIVMEYVEGQSLADRLREGALPLDELLSQGIQIARALQRAHRQGIVHRDLKPGNVMLTKAGVKLLDFGLAKLTAERAGETNTLSAQLTAAKPLTREGTYVGTLPYMSPEQLDGKDADSRSDIWSLGTVLYEMATGKRAFVGSSQAGVVGAILGKEPPSLATVQPLAPAALERAVHTCLAKDPDERWQDAGDVARELQWIREGGSHSVRPRRTGRRWRTRMALALAAVTVAASLAAWALIARGLLRVGPPPPVPRFLMVTMRHGIVASARFAPDGQGIVYTASWEGAPYELFQTRQGATEARSLGLTRMRILAISAQGEMAVLRGEQNVNRGFGVLTRAPLSGGAPRDVAEDVFEADWTPDGRELAAIRSGGGGKRRVEFPLGRTVHEAASGPFSLRVSPDGLRVAFYDWSATGHDVVTVDRAGRKAILSRGWPQGSIAGLDWSPRGDEVVFSASRGPDGPSLHAVSLAGRERALVGAPRFFQLHDVFADGRALVTTGPARGGMVCLPPGQSAERELGWLDFPVVADISADGALVLFSEHRAGGGTAGGSIYVRRTDGSPAVRLGEGRAAALSHDGKWVLAIRPGEPRWQLLPTGAGTTRTLDAVPADRLASGNWLPDGNGIVFTAFRGATMQTYIQEVATGAFRPIGPQGARLIARSVTPDGRFALAGVGGNVRWFPLDGGESQPIAWLGNANSNFLGWSADGATAFVARGSGPRIEIQRVDVRTGRAQLWKTLAPTDPVGIEQFGPAVVAGGGRSYCYSYDRQLSDLYIVEGLDLAPRRAR